MTIANIPPAAVNAALAAPGASPLAASNGAVPDFLSILDVLSASTVAMPIPAYEKTVSGAAGDQGDMNATSRKEEKEKKETAVADPLLYVAPQTITPPPPVLLFQILDFSISHSPAGDAAAAAGPGDPLPAATPPPDRLHPPTLVAAPEVALRLKIFGIEPQLAASPLAVDHPPPVKAMSSATLLRAPVAPLSEASDQVRPNDPRQPTAAVAEPASAPTESAALSTANSRGQASNSDARHSRSSASDDPPADSRPPQSDGVPATHFDLRGLEPEMMRAPHPHAPAQSESSPIRLAATSAAPQPRTEPVRELSLHVPDSNQGKVDVHILNQGGRIQVDVRASDAGLAQSLRTNVADLMSQLHDRGYRAEADPLNGIAGAATLDASGQQLQQDADRHHDPGAGGDRHPHNPQQQQQHEQQRRRQAPAWFQYFNESSQPAERPS